ncbi:MAG: ABC-ATPase domain-containing protein [Acetobacteraceae bacterium]|nr:ABC-ATPase domain-containing protein [Acetobacteraceae bacterium]
MQTAEDLARTLGRIDGRGYKAYQDIAGSYDFGRFQLFIDHVQGDPFAAPTRARVRVAQGLAGFPPRLYASRGRRVGLQDYLTRAFLRAASRYFHPGQGTGKSGLCTVDRPGQEVLERTSAVAGEAYVEVRLSVGLPAAGRTVLGARARVMLCRDLPRTVEESLFYSALDAAAVNAHVELFEDQEALRSQLRDRGLVAFVGAGAVLPRESGVSNRPLVGPQVVAFAPPPSLEVEFQVPNRGRVRGMGIPRGVTLIVGGGYHGKSTLLRAIEAGVYNHVAGDGREWVVTVPGAVKIRAEDGRRVAGVDITPFIGRLPQGVDTASFSTEAASGSTSQAANIMEALEAGATLLLLDEDTSATNFMIRDRRMQALVAKDREPITPFIDKVRQLYLELGVSTVMVVGGSGDYLDVADTVVMMDEYRPRDVTREAREVAAAYPQGRQAEGGQGFGRVAERVPLPQSFDATRGRREKVGAKGRGTVLYGREVIDLSAVEQVADSSQAEGIARLIHYAAERYFDGRTSLRRGLELALSDVESRGLEVLSPFSGHPGDYALPRLFEAAAAVNRLRSLRVRQHGPAGGSPGGPEPRFDKPLP